MLSTQPSHKRTKLWLGALCVGVLFAGAGVLVTNKNLESHRTHLLITPATPPAWITHLAPEPGRQLAVRQAHFGEADDPFWPGYGSICVQIDGAMIGITTLDELNSSLQLSLNGSTIRQVNPELLKRMPRPVPRFVVLYGLRPVDGIIHASFSDRRQYLNMCWEIILEPGDYVASLRMASRGQSALYEWAFRLTEE
jgi:hypothetical protein